MRDPVELHISHNVAKSMANDTSQLYGDFQSADCVLRIKVHCRNQPNKTRIVLYKPVLSL